MTKEDILAWVEKELDVMKTTVCPCRKLSTLGVTL